jgi:hypothetical protein
MCHTRGLILQQIQDVWFLGESLQIAMAVFDVIVFVTQIIILMCILVSLKCIPLVQFRRQ